MDDATSDIAYSLNIKSIRPWWSVTDCNVLITFYNRCWTGVTC